MTASEYNKLAVGDIISHGSVPWGRWVVLAKASDGGWHATRILQSGAMEHHKVTVPTEWLMVSRVIKRKEYDV